MKKQTLLAALIIALLAFTDVSCKKKKTNSALYDDAKDPGLSFYRGIDSIYSPAGGSPHGNFKLKFNAAAIAAFDASGKLPAGSAFSDGALIVKEVYTGNTLTLYAVMKKDSKSKYASKGWLWAEFEPGGKVHYNVSKEGAGCVSCHSANNHRDYTRSFDLH